MDPIAELKRLTGKKHIYLTDRGNTSISLSFKLARHQGLTTAYLQDQGGWITYEQFLKKLKFEMIVLKTDHGLITHKNLEEMKEGSMMIMNSMPGYFALQEDMERISEYCSRKRIFLINDASGSIGTDAARHGDIIVGSFGEWKPVEVGYGGFVAYDGDHTDFFISTNIRPVRDFSEDLSKQLTLLKSKQERMFHSADEIKKRLAGHDVIHRQKKGYNVIVRFKNDEEKGALIEFCNASKLEYTLCPRYIRVLDDAISIEMKRGF